MEKTQAPGFEFPCDYKVKAMGLDEPHFDALVVVILLRNY